MVSCRCIGAQGCGYDDEHSGSDMASLLFLIRVFVLSVSFCLYLSSAYIIQTSTPLADSDCYIHVWHKPRIWCQTLQSRHPSTILESRCQVQRMQRLHHAVLLQNEAKQATNRNKSMAQRRPTERLARIESVDRPTHGLRIEDLRDLAEQRSFWFGLPHRKRR